MKRLGEAVNLQERLADIDRTRQEYRAHQIATFGWSDDVFCASCGDTGRMPDNNNRPCHCAKGQEIEHLERQEASWFAICPRRFRTFSLATHPNTNAVQEVHTWLADGSKQGQNLVLFGAVGTGKTGLAIGLLRRLHLLGKRVKFGTVPDLLDAMRPQPETDPEAGMKDLQRVGILLMDDLGAEKASEWVSERLYLLINGRYERELPTIVTTNRTVPELQQAIGERTVSRLMEDAVVVHVSGTDLRRKS